MKTLQETFQKGEKKKKKTPICGLDVLFIALVLNHDATLSAMSGTFTTKVVEKRLTSQYMPYP